MPQIRYAAAVLAGILSAGCFVAVASAEVGAAHAAQVLTSRAADDAQVVQVAGRSRRPPQAKDATDGATATPPPATDGAAASTTVPQLPPLPRREEGPRHTLDNCMKLWDAETHMTKAEWRTTCKRSIMEAERARKADEARRGVTGRSAPIR